MIEELTGQVRKGESATKAPIEYRKDIVQDDETDINDRYYGNNDIMAQRLCMVHIVRELSRR